MNQKKGELTSAQIVTLIVIIASFIVLLFFLFRLNPAETTSKETCHNSVVLIGRSAGITTNLDCSTSYPQIESSNKNATLKAIADEMTECWWMFGEGKVDYADASFTGEKTCAVCSILSFKSEEGKEIEDVSYEEIYDYLRTTQKSQSQSYLKYIYSVNSLDMFVSDFHISNYLSNNIDTSKEYFVLTGISKKPVWRWFTISDVNHIPVTILEKTKANYDAIGCDEFITKS